MDLGTRETGKRGVKPGRVMASKAEDFLAALPAGTKGIILSERGFCPISGDTSLADIIVLVEIAKATVLANAAKKFRMETEEIK